jgi:hypothetical protein
VADKRALFKGLFDGKTDELRFDGGSAMVSVLERLVEDAPSDAGAAASEEREDDLLAAAGEEDLEAAETGVAREPVAPTGNQTAAATGGDVDRLFGSVSVRRRDDGGVVIEAPPDAARALESMFEGMARLMAAVAPPAT